MPAAARIFATSGERSCEKLHPICNLLSLRACFTELMRIFSDGKDSMVRAIELHRVVQLIHQVEPVLGQERKNRIEPLLQVAMRVEEPGEIPGVGGGPFVTTDRFGSRFPPGLFELIKNFRSTLVERGGERVIEALQFRTEIAEVMGDSSRGASERPLHGIG